MKRKKGFTLVELLVVISIIALLMAILMPALAQVRRLAQRIMCGANLTAIAKAMLVYSNDNDEDLPRAGGRGAKWDEDGSITQWDVPQTETQPENKAFGQPPTSNTATITSCFYLLVKYTDAATKVFICGGDSGAKTFQLSEATSTPKITDLTLGWDFGGDSTKTVSKPGTYCSYSYQMPFNHTNSQVSGTSTVSFALTSSSNSASPVCADRNPYLDPAAAAYVDKTITGEQKQSSWDNVNNKVIDRDHVRNAAAHSREGQNVAYVDAHVEFEKEPTCGINNDSIWMCWWASPTTITAEQRQWYGADYTGKLKKSGKASGGPVSYEDAFLVNELPGTNSD